MGMLSRMSTIVKSKMNRILDSAEDPRETLDYSYEKQLEMLRNVKRGVVEMVTAKRQIQQQASTVQGNISKLESQARQALEAGREDLARLALQRKQAATFELQGLDEQIAGMEMEQEDAYDELIPNITETDPYFIKYYSKIYWVKCVNKFLFS